jgi:hypothetical protein
MRRLCGLICHRPGCKAGAKLYLIEAIDFDLLEKKEGAGTLTAINP